MANTVRSIFEYAIIFGVIALVFGGSSVLRYLGLADERDDGDTTPLSFEKLESLVQPDPHLVCPNYTYTPHIVSIDPLVVYLADFIAPNEAAHLIALSEGHWKPSTVFHGGNETLDPAVRISEKAQIERDTTVQCIEERARAFQGWRQDVFIEKLWTQRYREGGHYVHHYDWGSANARTRRVSSFMVYLAADADCEGGGTNFPRLRKPVGTEWCDFIECDVQGPEAEGITFKPIAGNAVFWENFRSDGSGYEESWHAGMPVRKGTKIGLNIWSWYHKGLSRSVGSEKQL